MCRGSAADPGSTPRPGSLCCVSLPLSFPVSCHPLQAVLLIKPEKGQKKYLKKKGMI